MAYDLLREMLQMEEGEKSTPSMKRKVYHDDYVATKGKDYRQYDAAKYKKRKKKQEAK